MAQEFHRFDNPPVVEVVLGVQFAPLVSFTNGHFGWYWKQYLSDEWTRAADAPALPDQFETFEAERRWQTGLQMILESSPKPGRLQISKATGGRMIQVQPTRFHYNWQKRDDVYPTYPQMRAEFDGLFSGFCRFVADAGLGEVRPNQWELTYVDHIPRGPLWDTPAAWHKILPGILAPREGFRGTKLEDVAGQWNYEIEPRRGRIHVVIQHVRVGAPNGPEVLQLQTTARGPVRLEPSWDLDAGLRIGHEAVLSAFLEMTSPEAQEAWGRMDK